MLDRRNFVLLSAAASVAVPVPALAAAKPSRASEVRALRLFAETTHPRGREAAADKSWAGHWSALEAGAQRLSDGAYFIALRRGLGWFEDGHTTVLPFEFTGGVPEALKAGPFGLALPLRAEVFADGAFVTAAGEAARTLLGQRLERVGAKSTIDIMRAHADKWPGNKAWAQRWAGAALTSPAQLHGLAAIADPAGPIAIRTAGSSLDLTASRVPSESLTSVERTATEREGWAKQAGGGNYVRPLPDRRSLYLSIDDMGDVAGMTFEQLTRDAFAAMADPAVDRIIVDLRRNGGGNNYLGEPLRKQMAASRFNRPGGLYVLISPQTFSAAQNLANRLERETFALFVGEPTGGAPNHYGDASPFQGKASEITAIVSTIPWFDSYPQDPRPWIMPDLPVPRTFADWLAGRDRALDVALAHRGEGTADFLSRERIFYFRRASQTAEWKPFWL